MSGPQSPEQERLQVKADNATLQRQATSYVCGVSRLEGITRRGYLNAKRGRGKPKNCPSTTFSATDPTWGRDPRPSR